MVDSESKSILLSDGNTERVVFWLPRGCIIIDDLGPSNHASWSVKLYYYDKLGSLIHSTHFHESYEKMWLERPDTQLRKLGVPPGDWDHARDALFIAVALRMRKGKPVTSVIPNDSERVSVFQPSVPIYLKPPDATTLVGPQQLPAKVLPDPSSVEKDPLARLKGVRSALTKHRDRICPGCGKHALAVSDVLELERDAVSRTWACKSCEYATSAFGLPIADWETSMQDEWYAKAAGQRAREAVIRCPTCGNESIKAKETGVKSVGTSTHVTLSCKITGCDFEEREIQRSIVGTGGALLRNVVLTVVVLTGLALVACAISTFSRGAPSSPPISSSPIAPASGNSQIFAPDPIRIAQRLVKSVEDVDPDTLLDGRLEIPVQGRHWKGYPDPRIRTDTPRYVKPGGNVFDIQVGGYADGLLQFSLVSPKAGRFFVSRLLLKLRGFKKCSLRDEHYELQVPEISPAYVFRLSSAFSEYEIVPLASPGSGGGWQLGPSQSDNFSLRLTSDPYTLFLFTVEADVQDQDAQNSGRVATDYFKLLTVAQGNTGGCLDTKRWYSTTQMNYPTKGPYRRNLDILTYQLLTFDGENDRTFALKAADTPGIADALKDARTVARSSPDNLDFAKNILLIAKSIEWMKAGKADPKPFQGEPLPKP